MSSAPRKDVVLGHSDESDGIEEYDNRLPNWWVGLFVVCVIYGVIYAVHFHFVAKTSQAAWYDEEMADAAVRWPAPTKEEAMASAASPDAVAAGKELYATNCIGCHGADATGGIGPNLTDAEWIHGGTLEQINNTVTNGVPEKGMLAWGPILGAAKVAQVSAYVHSLGGGS